MSCFEGLTGISDNSEAGILLLKMLMVETLDHLVATVEGLISVEV